MAPDTGDMTLASIGGRPVYLLAHGERQTVVLAGDTGEKLPLLGASDVRKIAEQFSREAARDVDGPFDYDQWVVYQGFDSARPFYRVALSDAASTDLYISSVTGQVLHVDGGTLL